VIYKHLIPKVLVGVVTYKGKDYCKEEFRDRLKNLTYENYKPFIVQTDSFGGNSRERVTEGYNIVLEEFRNGEYDYLLTLEADIIPPKYIIEALMAHQEEICSATYMIGFKKDRKPCIFDGRKFKRKIGDKWVGVSQVMEPKDLDGTMVHAPGGSGLGCLLISKKVLDDFKGFRSADAHCDTYFHEDVQRLGFKTMVDTGIMCIHYGNSEEWVPKMTTDF